MTPNQLPGAIVVLAALTCRVPRGQLAWRRSQAVLALPGRWAHLGHHCGVLGSHRRTGSGCDPKRAAARPPFSVKGDLVRRTTYVLTLAVLAVVGCCSSVLFGGWWRSPRRGVALVAVLALFAAAGCTGRSPHVSRSVGSRSTAVSPGRSAVLQMPGGLKVTVPAGAVTRPGELVGSVTRAPGGTPRSMAFATPVYDLHLTGTSLKGHVELVVHLAGNTAVSPTAGPHAALLVSYDASAGGWVPAAATYDSATRTLTATTPHLSIWSVLQVSGTKILAAAASALKGFLGVAVAPQLTCPNTSQLASDGIHVTSSPGDLVKWCAGVSGAGAAIVRITSTRNYPVDTDYPSDWSVRRLGDIDPVTRAVLSLPNLLSLTGGSVRSVIIPSGGEIELSPPAGASAMTVIVPSRQGILTDALLYGVNELVMAYGHIPWGPAVSSAKTVSAIRSAFQAKDCLTALEALARGDTSTAAAAGAMFRSAVALDITCLAHQWDTAYGIGGQVGTFILSYLLWLADGVKLVIGDLHALVDNALYWSGYRIAFRTRTAAPIAELYVKTGYVLGSLYKYPSFPARIGLTNDDWIGQLHWAPGSQGTITGTGTLHHNTCSPDCASGNYLTHPIDITASSPQDCAVKVYPYPNPNNEPPHTVTAYVYNDLTVKGNIPSYPTSRPLFSSPCN